MKKPWVAKPMVKKAPGAMNRVDKPPTPSALKGNTKQGGRSANYLTSKIGKKSIKSPGNQGKVPQ